MKSVLGQFSVRAKLFAGFGIVLALMILMSLVAISQLRYLNQQVGEVVEGSVAPLISAQRLQAANKDSGIALRDIVSLESVAAQKQSIKALKEVQQRFVETLNESQKSADGKPEEVALLEKLNGQYKLTLPMIDEVLGLVEESDFDNAKLYVFTKVRPKQIELAETISAFLNLQMEKAKDTSTESGKAITKATSTLIVILVAALLIGSVLAIAVTKGIVGPLQQASQIAASVAQGIFTHRVEVSGNDEVSRLLQAFNNMSDSLSRTIHEIRTEAGRTAQFAQQLANDAQDAERRSVEQVEQVMSITSAMEEMAVSIREVFGNANGVHDAAEIARTLSVQGSECMGQNLKEVELIVNQVQNSSTIISELSREITQISTITSVIKDIADQTNLLALNAAIEAARAGESGRGFAVVADEVRKLAERTGQSTAEISAMLTKIESRAAETVSSMEQVQSTVQSGSRDSRIVDETLQKIVDSIAQVSTLVGDIASATQEQSRTTEMTARGVETISSVSEETNRTIRHVGETAEKMNKVSQELQQLVGRFQINA